jgi:hypothetical protein
VTVAESKHPTGSPLWWVDQLTPRLSAQKAAAAKSERYYDGIHAMDFVVTTKYREQFAQFLRRVVENWCPIVVDAVTERLNVQGIRHRGDTTADDAAWAIWQRNCLDADAQLAHRATLTAGRAALMVWAGADGMAEITVEHSAEVAVAYAPGNRRMRAAAIKQWTDEWTGEDRVNVYLPDQIAKFHTLKGALVELPSGDQLANPLGVVPVVELRNRMDLRGGVRSELAEVIPTQDMINKLVCDMLVAAEYAAFRQRWATGIDIPIDEETKQPVQPFSAAVDRVWAVGNPDAKFGDFAATDLGPYIAAIDSRVQSLASRSRTPPHYLLGGSAVMPSGESIKSAETGLVAKVVERQTAFGEAWEEALRLALLVEDGTTSADRSSEIIWRDPETRTESEHIDALVKKRAIGVPLQQLWEDAGYTPTQIARFRTMLLEEALAAPQSAPVEPVRFSTEPLVDPTAA